METMYDTLLQLPLFQGLCNEDFTKILDKVKLNFTKYKAGDVILKSGMPCTQLVFLLKGEASSETVSHDGSFVFTEHLAAPHLIEPYVLVGMAPYYTATYTARTELNTISISKEAVFKQLFEYDIFRLNFLNILSRRAQSQQAHLWEEAPRDLEDKFVLFVLRHIEKRHGEKTIKTKMEDLGRYVDETRLNVSKMLNKLQDEKLLELRRKEILIPDAALLAEWNHKRHQ